jgi:DnaJ family protein C protein 8
MDVLNVPHTASKEDISKAYRSASLQVHPDKFSAGPQRDKAQTAFTMLAAAKDDLLDDAKREALDAVVDQARQKVLTNRAAEGRKKRKVGDSGAAAAAGGGNDDDEESDPSKDPNYDAWVRAEVKEIIIEREWRKRQLLKAAAVEDTLAAEGKAKRAADKAARDAAEKEWEEKRDDRINSWRNFQKSGLKGKGAANKLRMPKQHVEDANATFVRRPVTHESSEK